MTKVVFLVLILILFTWLLHKPKTIKNNNLNSSNNLNKLINKANYIFRIENFTTSNSPTISTNPTTSNSPTIDATANLKEALTKTTTTVMPDSTDPPPDSSSECDRTIDNIIEDLEQLETKCDTFEQKQNNKYKDERTRLDDLYRNQLEIETDKIEQLKGLVKYYKTQYDTKLNINNKCRQETQLKLDKDTNFVNKNRDNLQAQKLILELNKDQ